MDTPAVAGWEHIEAAAAVLKSAIDDAFRMPEAAQDRAIAVRDALGEEHGDDLTCGCWRAAMTATSLIQLAGRHADAVVFLADAHPGFAPSAWAVARASLESSLRVAWLLDSDDPVLREQRWLSLEADDAKLHKNIGVIDEDEYKSRLQHLAELSGISGGDPKVSRPPSAERLTREYGRSEQLYVFYRLMSQPIHGTLAGAATFDDDERQIWMQSGNEGEWLEAQFWSMPIVTAWEGLRAALPMYRNLLCPDENLPSLQRSDELVAALEKVPRNQQARRQLGLGLDGRPIGEPRPNRAQRRAAERKRREHR